MHKLDDIDSYWYHLLTWYLPVALFDRRILRKVSNKVDTFMDTTSNEVLLVFTQKIKEK